MTYGLVRIRIFSRQDAKSAEAILFRQAIDGSDDAALHHRLMLFSSIFAIFAPWRESSRGQIRDQTNSLKEPGVSLVIGAWSLVIYHGPLLIAHRSSLIGHGSFIFVVSSPLFLVASLVDMSVIVAGRASSRREGAPFGHLNVGTCSPSSARCDAFDRPACRRGPL